MLKKYLIIFFGIISGITSSSLFASEILKGTVYELINNKKTPLPFATIFWLGTSQGTTTDHEGAFQIQKPTQNNTPLIVSFIGYESDTIAIGNEILEISITLQKNAITLNSVQVQARPESAFIDKIALQKSEIITTDGLCRLACCNLAESFENTATIDVGYSDAVSGARHIQMLGLSGIYSQLMIENIPFIRGLSAPFGLLYVPGSFMGGIQISKGVSSVVNGYESMTGQINLEYKKPQNADPLFINLFMNDELKEELNIVGSLPLNKRLSTMLLAHGSWFNQSIDHIGHDGFMDVPKSTQLNLVNRWFYDGDVYKNISLINYIRDRRTGGQMGFERTKNRNDSLYGIAIDIQRLQFTTKNGIILNEASSIALQLSGTYFEQKALYGLNDYSGNEKNLYANLIYENTISGNNKFSTGSSFQLNQTEEFFINGQPTTDTSYSLYSNELIPGVFAQYSGELSEKFSFIAGFRYDHHSQYGAILTPRIHMKWNIKNHFQMRVAGGKGYRTPFVLAENFGLMASSRRFMIPNDLQIENAWNYGINFYYEAPFKEERLISFSLDIFRTDFIKQIITDLDKSSNEIHFYNLNGRSFSNSIQADVSAEVLPRFKITLAGRYNDVRQTINEQLREKPYVSKWKGLLVLSYATPYDKWIFDLTTQINGKQRLPNTNDLRPGYSKPYLFMLGQITKKFKHIDVYAGCENITNFVQKDPIIEASNPFGGTFDASVIYAPTMGRMFYIGLRWTIQ